MVIFGLAVKQWHYTVHCSAPSKCPKWLWVHFSYALLLVFQDSKQCDLLVIWKGEPTENHQQWFTLGSNAHCLGFTMHNFIVNPNPPKPLPQEEHQALKAIWHSSQTVGWQHQVMHRGPKWFLSHELIVKALAVKQQIHCFKLNGI